MTSAVRPSHDRLERRLEARLGVAVDARRRLVEDEERRVAVERAREREELALARAEVRAALVDARPRGRPRGCRKRSSAPIARERLLDPLEVGHVVAHRDVRGDRAGEQEDVLRHDGEELAQLAAVVARARPCPSTRTSPCSSS